MPYRFPETPRRRRERFEPDKAGKLDETWAHSATPAEAKRVRRSMNTKGVVPPLGFNTSRLSRSFYPTAQNLRSLRHLTASAVNAEWALFGAGMSQTLRSNATFKSVLLSMSEDAAAKVVIVNGPPPGNPSKINDRTVTSGTWSRWDSGAQRFYRIKDPSAKFFPKLIEAIDKTPGGKGMVAGTLLAQYLATSWGALWKLATGSSVIEEAGAAAGGAAANTATGGKPVTSRDVYDAAADGSGKFQEAVAGGMTVVMPILSGGLGTLFGPAPSADDSAPGESPPDDPAPPAEDAPGLPIPVLGALFYYGGKILKIW